MAGFSTGAPVPAEAVRGPFAAARPADPNRIGVVFVHGIGTQPACETFLDWSASITRVLSDWRTDQRQGGDPVVRCDYDLSGASLPILELDIPEWHGHPAQRWVMTEAWWAASTRPPALGYMTDYVFNALGPIMTGIRRSYGVRKSALADLRDGALAFAGDRDDHDSRLVRRTVRRRRFDWIDLLDRIQKELTILAFGPALIMGRVALAAYAPFRAIPIPALQDAAALKYLDNFLTRWFGELPEISCDPIQSANVRHRLAQAVRGLRAEGCGRMVVVAHSGGAIVSFETLCDAAYKDIDVDKLVTLGEGLALTWRIEHAWKALPPGSRLLGDLTRERPSLLWADFWSTYDPAPAGPIDPPPPGVRIPYRPTSTVNRMSILEDHGSYWDNDEEFMIPLLQNIDVPTKQSRESRFFPEVHWMAVRQAWRRERVAVLALWRWIAALGAGVPIVCATGRALLGAAGAAGLSTRPGPERLGADFAGLWSHVPGHEVIAGPLDGLSQVASWPGQLPLFGEWAVGTAIVAVAFVVLARIGVGRWEAWDLVARRAARKPVPERSSRLLPFVQLGLLTILDVAMVAGAFWLFWR